MASVKTPAKTKPASVVRAPQQTALAKIMPDYIHPKKKRKHIVAHVDIGWGNAIYLRGDGGGLNWDVGLLMDCLTNEHWVISFPEENAPREIKFLRNDEDWALGDNCLVSVEEFSTFTPVFL